MDIHFLQMSLLGKKKKIHLRLARRFLVKWFTFGSLLVLFWGEAAKVPVIK